MTLYAPHTRTHSVYVRCFHQSHSQTCAAHTLHCESLTGLLLSETALETECWVTLVFKQPEMHLGTEGITKCHCPRWFRLRLGLQQAAILASSVFSDVGLFLSWALCSKSSTRVVCPSCMQPSEVSFWFTDPAPLQIFDLMCRFKDVNRRQSSFHPWQLRLCSQKQERALFIPA